MKHPNFYREMLINDWFGTKFKDYGKNQLNGKSFDKFLQIKYPPFITLFNKIWKKNMRYFDSKADCFNECLVTLYEGLHNFKIPEGSSWKEIAEKTDIDSFKQLVAYLKTHVERTVSKNAGGYIETNRNVVDEEGNTRRVRVHYKISTNSLNQTITTANSIESDIELGDLATESYWGNKGDYNKNDFLSWLDKNLINIITTRQADLLAELSNDTNFNKLGEDDIFIYFTGSKKDSVNNHLNKIRTSVVKEYDDAHGNEASSHTIRMIEEELKALTHFLELDEDGASDDVLTEAVINNLDSYCWDRLVYNELSLEAQKDIVSVWKTNVINDEKNLKVYVGKEVLNYWTLDELVAVIEWRIEHLKKVLEFERKAISERDHVIKDIKKQYFNVPANVNYVYLNIDADGLWKNECED